MDLVVAWIEKDGRETYCSLPPPPFGKADRCWGPVNLTLELWNGARFGRALCCGLMRLVENPELEADLESTRGIKDWRVETVIIWKPLLKVSLRFCHTSPFPKFKQNFQCSWFENDQVFCIHSLSFLKSLTCWAPSHCIKESFPSPFSSKVPLECTTWLIQAAGQIETKVKDGLHMAMTYL